MTTPSLYGPGPSRIINVTSVTTSTPGPPCSLCGTCSTAYRTHHYALYTRLCIIVFCHPCDEFFRAHAAAAYGQTIPTACLGLYNLDVFHGWAEWTASTDPDLTLRDKAYEFVERCRANQ